MLSSRTDPYLWCSEYENGACQRGEMKTYSKRYIWICMYRNQWDSESSPWPSRNRDISSPTSTVPTPSTLQCVHLEGMCLPSLTLLCVDIESTLHPTLGFPTSFGLYHHSRMNTLIRLFQKITWKQLYFSLYGYIFSSHSRLHSRPYQQHCCWYLGIAPITPPGPLPRLRPLLRFSHP